jgi:uncharacterized protein YjiS (DUF1127 family)
MFALHYPYVYVSVIAFGWLARFASAIARFRSRRRRARHVRLMSAELRALDDRMLKDIGLRRYHVGSAVLNGAPAEWYAPLAEPDWPAKKIPQTHGAMPTHKLTERHRNDDP